MAIRNIIFDMGQVLISWDPAELMRNVGLDGADAALVKRELFDEVEWIASDAGTMTEEEVVTSVCQRLPERLRDAVHALVFDWWKWPLSPKEGMDELIRELKGNGYRIYLLSNASIRLPEYFPRLPGSDCFDGAVVSALVQMIKPSEEIYRCLCERYDLIPGECWFIDDNTINMYCARRFGLQGCVFHDDIPLLRERMRAAGINVRA